MWNSYYSNNNNWNHVYAGETTGVIEKKLDSCVVTVYPSLNPDHETLTVPHNMITQFGITAKLSKDGATLSGSNIIYNYEQVSILESFFVKDCALLL